MRGQAPCRAAPRQSGGWQGFALWSLGTLTDQPATSHRHAVLAQLMGTEEESEPLPAEAPCRVHRGFAGLALFSPGGHSCVD